MMIVRYLKPTFNAKVGTVRSLKITDARLLIAMGICEQYKEETPKQELPKKRGRMAKAEK